MSEREFTDADGLTWYVSEGFNGTDRYLRFDSADESRCVFTYPPTWAQSSSEELAELFRLSIVTWKRGQLAGDAGEWPGSDGP